MGCRTVLAFPGQGSQRPGMLESAPSNDAFDRLTDAAEALTGLELRAISALGGEDELSDTRVAQPLLYLTDWAWGVAVLEAGLVPAAVTGHSLGELAALAIAGVYSPEAGLELVVERSRLMAVAAAATPGGMLAVIGLPADDTRAAIDPIENVWVANDNSAKQVVVSGESSSIERATQALEQAGARRVIPLSVAGAFHSPLMEPAQASFADILSQTEFFDASIPVVQNTEPTLATGGDEIRTRLASQIANPVRWVETMQVLCADETTVLVESGPGSVLTGLARGVEGLQAFAVEEVGTDRILEEVCS